MLINPRIISKHITQCHKDAPTTTGVVDKARLWLYAVGAAVVSNDLRSQGQKLAEVKFEKVDDVHVYVVVVLFQFIRDIHVYRSTAYGGQPQPKSER